MYNFRFLYCCLYRRNLVISSQTSFMGKFSSLFRDYGRTMTCNPWFASYDSPTWSAYGRKVILEIWKWNLSLKKKCDLSEVLTNIKKDENLLIFFTALWLWQNQDERDFASESYLKYPGLHIALESAVRLTFFTGNTVVYHASLQVSAILGLNLILFCLVLIFLLYILHVTANSFLFHPWLKLALAR